MNIKKEEYELFAIGLLEETIDDFPVLKKGESPDFYSDDIGVEVTRVITKNQGKFEAFLKESCNQVYSSINKGLLNTLGFIEAPVQSSDYPFLYLQNSIENGILYYYMDKKVGELRLLWSFSCLQSEERFDCIIKEAVLKKIKKLNKNYSIKNSNRLVLIAEEQIGYSIEETIKNDLIKNVFDRLIRIIKEVYNTQESSRFSFDVLYIIFLDNILIVNTKTWDTELIHVEEMQLNKAINYAIKNENK